MDQMQPTRLLNWHLRRSHRRYAETRHARGGPHTYIIQQISDPIVVVFDTSGVVNSGRFLVAPRATKKCRFRAHEKRIFWIIRNRKFYSLQLRTIFRPFSQRIPPLFRRIKHSKKGTEQRTKKTIFLDHPKLRLFPIQNDSYFSLLCEPEIFAEITTRKLPKSSKLDHNLCRYAAHLCNTRVTGRIVHFSAAQMIVFPSRFVALEYKTISHFRYR